MKTHPNPVVPTLRKSMLLALFGLAALGVEARPPDSGNIEGWSHSSVFLLLLTVVVLFVLVIYAQGRTIRSLAHLQREKNRKRTMGKGAAGALLVLLAFPASSQAMVPGANGMLASVDHIYWLLIGTIVLELFVVLWLHNTIQAQLRDIRGKAEAEAPDLIESFTARLTDSVPVEREEEVMLDHAYDGIRELDNNLPPWWKYSFYISIVWSVGYLFYYHNGDPSRLMAGEYEQQLAEARALREAGEPEDAAPLTLLTGSSDLKSGSVLFRNVCAPCHGQLAEGLPTQGPNLTDAFWLHGGGFDNVYQTIQQGVTAKGMPSWKNSLSPQQIQKVASYVISLEGSNPPNAKKAEGEPWSPEAAPPADTVQVMPPDSSAEGALTQHLQ